MIYIAVAPTKPRRFSTQLSKWPPLGGQCSALNFFKLAKVGRYGSGDTQVPGAARPATWIPELCSSINRFPMREALLINATAAIRWCHEPDTALQVQLIVGVLESQQPVAYGRARCKAL